MKLLLHMLSHTNKTCRVVKGEIFQHGPWTGQNFEGDPLRCCPLVSSQTKAFKPPKLGCIRNTSFDCFLSSTISKWLAIKMSYKQFPPPAASLCIQAYIQPTQKLSVLQQTALSLLILMRTFTTTSEGWGLTAPSVLHLNTCTDPRKKSYLSPLFLRSAMWLPLLLQNITRRWEQAKQTYVNIYLVGVWNYARVNAQYVLALWGDLPSDTVTQNAVCMPQKYFSHHKSLEGFVDEKNVFMYQKWPRLWAVLLLPNGAQAEEFNFFMFSLVQNSSTPLKCQVIKELCCIVWYVCYLYFIWISRHSK